MVRKDGSFVKVERINQIRKEIAKQFPNPVALTSLKLWVECTIGLGEQKAHEYIEKAVASNGWVIFNGNILAEAPS